ncbi:MAG: family peptidase [Rickettsiaceae bacterium]|jgi:murein DD-endopeptidase MepM/ murein hydrolase activator NlpD|nr:family peptidase [Rickettsiaceae bacterium]
MTHKLGALLVVIFMTLTSGQVYARSQDNTRVMLFDFKKGDTLKSILSSADVSGPHASKAIKELASVYNTKDLKPGQKIRLVVEEPKKKGQDLSLNSLQIKLSNNRRMEVLRLSGDKFVAQEITPPTKTKLVKASGEVGEELFSADINDQIPEEIKQTFIKNFSYNVDLQREIQAGDSFSMIFEQLYDQDGSKAGPGDIIFASLTLSGVTHEIFYYIMPDGQGDYYDERGYTVKKSLLKTPIYNARITSSFGARKHPILGYTKEHKGLDFGASSGTPIYSAGNGFIAEIGKKGSYGNYVRVKHDGKYSTAYAHLSKFAKGLSSGSKVSQGQIIGYVGTSGRSTGPHLHYEVIADGKQINPLSVKTFASYKLGETQMALFNKHKQKMFELSNRIDAKDKMASQ